MSKAKKLRACPAVGRDVTGLECGEHRGERYACPADCGFNPFTFANYDRLLELEDKLDPLCVARLFEARPELRPEFTRLVRENRPAATHSLVAWHLFFARDAAGSTLAERWEQAGYAGLNHDQRVLFRAKRGMRVALFEVRQVRDDRSTEVVDLLDPAAGPQWVCDRALARMACRFSAFLAWCYPLPHFLRFSGAALAVPELGDFTPAEVIREIAAHLGAPADGLPRWLAENFARVELALGATGAARRRQTFAAMDARFGKAVYELRQPFAACRDHLDTEPRVASDDLADEELAEGFADARAWFEDDPPADPEAPRAVLGRVLLGQAHWRLETMGGERLAALRAAFEGCLGERVKFAGERLDDLGARQAGPGPGADEALVPPRLLENPTLIRLSSSRLPRAAADKTLAEQQAEQLQRHYRDFLENPVPALDGQTPRAAARNPQLRPRLLNLLKSFVRKHDEDNLRLGRTDDINWLLRELGAEELCFAPPPLRAVPPAVADEDPDAGADADDDFPPPPAGEFLPDLPDPTGWPPTPPLPAAPLSFEEAQERLHGALDTFETAAEALDELSATGATVIEDFSRLVAERMTPTEFSFLVPLLLQAWFALVPPGTVPPPLDYDRLADAFDRELRAVDRVTRAGSPEALQRLINAGPQPGLTLLVTTQLLEGASTAPRKIRPGLATQPVMLAALRALIAELDRVLR